MRIGIHTNGVGKYFFVIDNETLLSADVDIAEFLGISLDNYTDRLKKISNGSLFMCSDNLYIDIDESENNYYINLFKEEFSKELILSKLSKS